MSLLDRTRDLLARTADRLEGTPREAIARNALERLDAPLRVAIAGRVKAGKSTLLNALVGERLAPTDAGECTKIVTWYRDGITYRVTLLTDEGPVHARFTRDDGAIEVDLGGRGAEDVEAIDIEWPTATLRELTLIDTPGIASISTDVSDRTHDFLAPGEEQPTEADAVLYLLRHVHAADLRFLEAFHDDEVAQATPVNAIGILSRADEVGVGRLDSMASARRIAARYRTDPKLRKLCQTVVPVAGLLGQAGSTLTEDEFRALGRIAALPEERADALMLSVDRFVAEDPDLDLLAVEREHLLDRLGLFGVRLATVLIRRGEVETSGELARRLVAESGLDDLRSVLATQFADRSGALKARSGLLVLDALLRDTDGDLADLEAEVESLQASAHEFAELRLLNLLRTGAVSLRAADQAEAERILGAGGGDLAGRLGVEPEAGDDALRAAVADAVGKWQRRAENPMADREQTEAARVVVRTLEGLAASIG
ncbi:MAG: dynamin family protein [Acidimicrobiia bacterium]|nr:dynamin family protein [Acidimicrobiia bacterium]